MPIDKDKKTLKENPPHIVVATPGRLKALIRDRSLNLKNIKHFVLDECDKMLDALGKFHHTLVEFLKTPSNDAPKFWGCLSKLYQWALFWGCLTKFLDMRRDVQEIFRGTPHDKQVMMFSATLSKETREICKKFMQDVNINFHYNNSKPSFPSSCHVPPIFGLDKTLVGSLAMVHVTSWYSPLSSNGKIRYVIPARAVARKIVRHIILWYYHSEDPYPHGIITSGDHFRSWFIETRVATSGIDDEMSDTSPTPASPAVKLIQFEPVRSTSAKLREILEMWNWF